MGWRSCGEQTVDGPFPTLSAEGASRPGELPAGGGPVLAAVRAGREVARLPASTTCAPPKSTPPAGAAEPAARSAHRPLRQVRRRRPRRRASAEARGVDGRLGARPRASWPAPAAGPAAASHLRPRRARGRTTVADPDLGMIVVRTPAAGDAVLVRGVEAEAALRLSSTKPRPGTVTPALKRSQTLEMRDTNSSPRATVVTPSQVHTGAGPVPAARGLRRAARRHRAHRRHLPRRRRPPGTRSSDSTWATTLSGESGAPNETRSSSCRSEEHDDPLARRGTVTSSRSPIVRRSG